MLKNVLVFGLRVVINDSQFIWFDDKQRKQNTRSMLLMALPLSISAFHSIENSVVPNCEEPHGSAVGCSGVGAGCAMIPCEA